MNIPYFLVVQRVGLYDIVQILLPNSAVFEILLLGKSTIEVLLDLLLVWRSLLADIPRIYELELGIFACTEELPTETTKL